MSRKIKAKVYCKKLEEYEYTLEVPDDFNEIEWAKKLNKKIENWDGKFISKKSALSSGIKHILDVKEINNEEIAKISEIY